MFEILQTSSTVKMLWKQGNISRSFYHVEHNFCFWSKGRVWGVLCKNFSLADLLGSQYFFEILQTSLTVKRSGNMVKSGSFEKHCVEERQLFKKMKEGYKASCVKILRFRWIIGRLLFIWNIAQLTHCEN